MSELVPVRLTSEFRGNQAGAVIQATPGLAGFLTSSGRATPAPDVPASRSSEGIEQAVTRAGAGS